MSKMKMTYYSFPKLPRVLKWMLMLLFLVALLGDFISNEKPLYYKENGEHHFPIFRSYAVKLGFKKSSADFLNMDWKSKQYEKVIRTIIPYSYNTIDLQNTYKSPLGIQNTKSWSWRHYLGTDALGRDVAAGLINGLRIALLVGIMTVLLIALIGIPYGIICGYFGDETLELSLGELLFILLGILLGVFYAFIAFPIFVETKLSFFNTCFRLLFFFSFVFSFRKIGTCLPILKQKIKIPIDFIGQKIIEILDAIPTLFLILPLMTILEPSVWNMVWVIGLLSWTGVARLVRAELLRIRSLAYIESAKALGLTPLVIISRHALPNALTPVIVALAFTFGSIVMVEAFLTFLGFGMPAGEVTWGSMLNGVRSNIRAWWLALFPGLAIFLLVSLANYIGRAIERQ